MSRAIKVRGSLKSMVMMMNDHRHGFRRHRSTVTKIDSREDRLRHHYVVVKNACRSFTADIGLHMSENTLCLSNIGRRFWLGMSGPLFTTYALIRPDVAPR